MPLEAACNPLICSNLAKIAGFGAHHFEACNAIRTMNVQISASILVAGERLLSRRSDCIIRRFRDSASPP